MKLRTVYGILPYIEVERDLDGKWGNATALFVRIDPTAPDHSRAHEKEHVRQFYKAVGMGAAPALAWELAFLWLENPPSYHTALVPVLLALPYIVGELVPRLDLRSEAEAYAVSVRNGRSLASATYALYNSDTNCKQTWSIQECEDAIKAR